MIGNELILLGLIKKSPRHGYDIKKELKDILSLFAGVNVKSVYYPLRVLEKKGLIVKQILKAVKRPLRYEYALSPKGEARFDTLLTQSLLDFKRPQFSLDLSLYFLNYIKPRIAKRRLRARIYILNQLIRNLRQMAKGFEKKHNHALSCILNHNVSMLEAESLFLDALIRTL